MATWPSTLPRAETAGYGIEPQSAVTRTDMEKGAARVRRTTTRPVTEVTVAWTFTLYEFETFEAWFHHQIQDGAEAFDCPMFNGRGLQTWSVRFVAKEGEKPYQAQALGGGNWRVQARLEAESVPMLTATELAARL